MGEKLNILRTFNSMLNIMSERINNIAIEVTETLKNTIPEEGCDYRIIFSTKSLNICKPLEYNKSTKKWCIIHHFEDACCSNDFPCTNPRDCIIGMVASEIADLFTTYKVEVQQFIRKDFKFVTIHTIEF